MCVSVVGSVLLKVKWGKQVQSGGEKQGGRRWLVPVNIHRNGKRSEAKARPFVRVAGG